MMPALRSVLPPTVTSTLFSATRPDCSCTQANSPLPFQYELLIGKPAATFLGSSYEPLSPRFHEEPALKSGFLCV
jgi:hypothetical protein